MKYNIGIIGNGFVGSSVAFGFSPQTGCDAEVKIYDKDDKTLPIIKEKFLDKRGVERERRYNKIIDVDEEKTIFDREVRLTGGYLKYIDDINKLGGEAGEIKVDPVTLMELIQKAPANNISVVSYSSNFVK